jgi:hypothetical protein
VLQKLQGEKMSDFLNVNGLEEFDDLLGSIYEQKEAVKIQRNQMILNAMPDSESILKIITMESNPNTSEETICAYAVMAKRFADALVTQFNTPVEEVNDDEDEPLTGPMGL